MATVLTLGLISVSWGQLVPYKALGSSASYFPLTGDYEGPGNATHLGKHYVLGNVETTPTGALTATWKSTAPQVTTAADGSTILFDACGEVELIPLDNLGNFVAVWSGTFEVAGGSGRFENVGPGPEPLTVTAVNDPFNILTDTEWNFSWTLEGHIDLGKRGKE